jgi:hypothetical protein
VLIKGLDLTPAQRAQVLAAYVHRWTVENAQQTYYGLCPGCEQSQPFPLGTITGTTRRVFTRAEWHAYHALLTTDDRWLAEHAFHFVKDGSRLHGNKPHAEPAYLGS